MTDWEDVPVTCSSEIEGWYIEALMRRNPALTYWDIQARMLDRFLVKQKNSAMATRGPWETLTLTNRAIRFRERSFNVPCKHDSSLLAYVFLFVTLFPKLE